MKSFKILCNIQERLDPSLQVPSYSLWWWPSQPPHLAYHHRPRKKAWELRNRKAPKPPSSPRPQCIPTPPPRRQWTGHRRRPGEMDGAPTRTSSQPPQGLPRLWAKSSQHSKGMRAGSCNQGRGHTSGGLDCSSILEASLEGKVKVKGDEQESS